MLLGLLPSYSPRMEPGPPGGWDLAWDLQIAISVPMYTIVVHNCIVINCMVHNCIVINPEGVYKCIEYK